MNRLYKREADFEAEITIVTFKQGGRRPPASNGIRWDFLYAGDEDTKEVWAIWPEFIDDDNEPVSRDLPLEGTYRARMYIAVDEKKKIHRCRIQVGTKFYCVEGPRKVAHGVVTKITGLAS